MSPFRPLIESRRCIGTELAGLEHQKERKHMEVEAATKEYQRLESVLAGLLETDAKARLARHERSRMIAHSFKARGTLREFRQRVIERNVTRIERLILESYQQLLRKTSLVQRIAIDPRTFAMSLFAPGGHGVEPVRLSAGERQTIGRGDAVGTCEGIRTSAADRNRHPFGTIGRHPPQESGSAIFSQCEPSGSIAVHRRRNHWTTSSDSRTLDRTSLSARLRRSNSFDHRFPRILRIRAARGCLIVIEHIPPPRDGTRTTWSG